MSEIVLLPAGVDPMSPETFKSMVATIAGRLREFTYLMGQSLREESWRTERTTRDWFDSFLNLDSAAAPLIQLFEGMEQRIGKSFTPALAEGLDYFRLQVSFALSALQNDGDATERQYAAIDIIRSAEIGLDRWLEKLGVDPYQDFCYRSSLPSEQAVLWDFEYGMSVLDSSLRSGSSVEVCMASRKQFLRAYYMAVVQPQLWTSARHAELVRRHADCLTAVNPGIELDSIRKRHEKLGEYSPARFTEKALHFAH